MAQPVVSFHDVTAILLLVADIRNDIRSIREVLVEDDGQEEEEDPEADS